MTTNITFKYIKTIVPIKVYPSKLQIILMRIFLKIGYYKRCIAIELIKAKKLILFKECMICHYWFFNHGFKFQDSVCNGCHDLAMLSINRNDIAIITIKNVDSHCIIRTISKSEAMNLFKKFVLKDRGYI